MSNEVTKRALDTIARIECREVEWAAEAAMRDPTAPDALERSQDDVPTGVNREEWLASRAKRAAPKPVQSQPQQRAIVMDKKSSDAWNGWLDRRLEKYFSAYSEMLGEEINKLFEMERADLRKEFDEQLATLRADLTRSDSDDGVLAHFPRKKHVA